MRKKKLSSAETKRTREKPHSHSAEEARALKELRSVLLLRRNAIRQSLGFDIPQEARYVRDEGEIAQDDQVEQVFAITHEKQLEELRAIEEALARMRRGVYRICAGKDCGRKIPLVRLEVLPFTRHCVDCARKRQEGNGDRLMTMGGGLFGTGFSLLEEPENSDNDFGQDEGQLEEGQP